MDENLALPGMKAKPDTAATVRAIIRWTTGAVVTVAITTGACFIFPLLSSFPAMGLTVCLSLFIGLNIALPPLDPEDDWVPVRSNMEQETATQPAAAIPAAKEKESEIAPVVEPVPGIGVLPVHIRRSSGAPTGTWHIIHPGLTQEEAAHKMILSQRNATSRRSRYYEDSLSEKSE